MITFFAIQHLFNWITRIIYKKAHYGDVGALWFMTILVYVLSSLASLYYIIQWTYPLIN